MHLNWVEISLDYWNVNLQTGNGRIRTVEMDEEVKSLRFRIGLQVVQDLQPILFGILVAKICTGLDLREWYVICNNNNSKLSSLRSVIISRI